MVAIEIESNFFHHDAQAGGFFPRTHINPGFDIDSLISGPGQNLLIEGIRGTGKTHILRMVVSRLIETYDKNKILPVYFSLATVSEWEDSDIRIFRLQLYANIVAKAISTIEDRKSEISYKKEGIEKTITSIKNMFGIKSESDIDIILDKIKNLNEKLLEKLTTNPNNIIKSEKSENSEKYSIGLAKTVQANWDDVYSSIEEKEVQYVVKALAYENAALFIVEFLKQLKEILGCKYTLILLDECSDVSEAAQKEIFRLLKLIRGACTTDLQMSYAYFFASVYPIYATSYPPNFEPGQDAGVEYLQLDELSDEYESFFLNLTQKRLEYIFDKPIKEPISEIFESDKAFYLAVYASNGIPRRYFEILKQGYGNLCQRADSDEINIQKISQKDIETSIQTIVTNQIISHKLKENDLKIIDEVVRRISQRNKKVDTENQRKKKNVPANVYFTISRSQYSRFTPLLLQGCLHDKNRTRLKKYWKEDGTRGSLLMLDLALAFQRGAILKQKAVNIYRYDLKSNAKDGYSSCQDFDLSQFSISAFVD